MKDPPSKHIAEENQVNTEEVSTCSLQLSYRQSFAKSVSDSLRNTVRSFGIQIDASEYRRVYLSFAQGRDQEELFGLSFEAKAKPSIWLSPKRPEIWSDGPLRVDQEKFSQVYYGQVLAAYWSKGSAPAYAPGLGRFEKSQAAKAQIVPGDDAGLPWKELLFQQTSILDLSKAGLTETPQDLRDLKIEKYLRFQTEPETSSPCEQARKNLKHLDLLGPISWQIFSSAFMENLSSSKEGAKSVQGGDEKKLFENSLEDLESSRQGQSDALTIETLAELQRSNLKYTQVLDEKLKAECQEIKTAKKYLLT